MIQRTPYAGRPVVGLWVVCAGAIVLPLAFVWTINDVAVLPKLVLSRLLIGALLVAWLFDGFRAGQILWRRTPLDLPLLALAASAALSTALAVNTNLAIFGAYLHYEGLLTILGYLLLFWLAVQVLEKPEHACKLVRALLVAGYFVSWVTIAQVTFLRFRPLHLAPGARPDATMANPDMLGMFLAMLIPLGLAEFIGARRMLTRLLALNLSVVLLIALALSQTRAAWIAAAIGTLIVLAGWLRKGGRRTLKRAAFAAAVILVGGVLAFASGGATRLAGSALARPIVARAQSLTRLPSDPNGSAIIRLRVWRDTLPLIGSNPLVGYGPDTFGLVFPRFESAEYGKNLQWDKAHSDILQVGATQGIIGVAAYVWLFAAIAVAWWRGRRRPGATALAAGVLAYQIVVQVDFSFLPSSLPFWLLLGAAVVVWGRSGDRQKPIGQFGISKWALGGVTVAVLAATAVGATLPLAADMNYVNALRASNRGDLAETARLLSLSRRLAPRESEYAAEAGDVALDLDAADNPGAAADWTSARSAYENAIQLGTFRPEAYRHLALVYLHFGLRQQALSAAQKALELDRYDPLSQQVVQQAKQGR